MLWPWSLAVSFSHGSWGWAGLGSLLWPPPLDFGWQAPLILISPSVAYLLEQGLSVCACEASWDRAISHLTASRHLELGAVTAPGAAGETLSTSRVSVHTAAAKGGPDLEHAALLAAPILKLFNSFCARGAAPW